MKLLNKALKRLLYYTHTVSEARDEASNSDEVSRVALGLVSDLSEAISPTLFTPPPAQHMSCTDTLARLWSDRAVIPALSPAQPSECIHPGSGAVDGEKERRIRPRGMADVIGMLGAWVEDGWEDEDGKVCEECLVFMREGWIGEAKAIWEKMDGWIEKIEVDHNRSVNV